MTAADAFGIVGRCRDGVPRVYGTGPSLDVAESRCREEALAYVARRRDTGPLDLWTFAPLDPPRWAL